VTKAIRWVWRELTRPRGPVQHAFYRSRRRSKSGVALLIVITSLLFMTVLVTEIAFAATVRLQLGAHQRDEAKAEALAETGVYIYQLVLTASKGLGKNPMIQQVEQMMGIDLGDALWQMIPFINTGMMRMIFVAGGDEDDIEDMSTEGMSEEQLAESRESSGFDKNFLDFDGDFYAEVTDEDRKINVSRFTAVNRADLMAGTDPTAWQLYGLMSGVRTCPSYTLSADGTAQEDVASEEREDLDRFFLDRNLERWELVGNLADWTDADNSRVYDGGAEDSLYNALEKDPYLPKNAGFDSLDEIRLVEGWHRDDVWERFGGDITVYGNGKINVNTAECGVIWGLLKSYIQPNSDGEVERAIRAIRENQAMQSFSSGTALVSFLEGQGFTVDPKMKSLVSAESKVFRVTSSGQVGDATVTVEAVLDYSSSQTGKIVYWRVR
jgi:type II secretory pathway component PulK